MIPAVGGRHDLDDLVVVQRQGAADAAVGTDRVGLRLAVLVPRAGGAHVVLGREHQRAGGTHLDAVAAVHARRIGKLDGVLGRDAGVEPAPGDTDGPRLLPLFAAGVDALVAEDALRIVTDVQRVVDLDGLVDRLLGQRAVWCVMVSGDAVVAGVVGGGWQAEPVLDRRRTPCSSAPRWRSARRSTDEPSSSSTSRRLCLVRAVSVRTTMSSSRCREHDGTSTRDPSTSTMHTLQAFFGVIVSP